MKKIQQLLAIFCLLFVYSSSDAGTLSEQQLSRFANQYLKKHAAAEHISAVAISVLTPNSRNPLSAFAGTTTWQGKNPVNPQYLFQIGSISKSFVAALLLKLEENPRYDFNINDPVDKFFPEYPKWHGITIRALMNMTSGIPDYFNEKTILSDYTHSPFLYHSNKNWVDYLYQQPLLFKPGSHFQYSNTNYLLLGMLVERLTGNTLQKELNRNIFSPLKLSHTFFFPHEPPSSLKPYLVHGYQFEKIASPYIPLGNDVSDFSLSYLGAAGGMISNSEDTVRWVQALFTPGKLLSASQLQNLLSMVSEKNGQAVKTLSASDRYGFGLGISAEYEPQYHTLFYIYQGITFGYRTMYIYVPKQQIVIAVTVNSSYLAEKNHLYLLIKAIYQAYVR